MPEEMAALLRSRGSAPLPLGGRGLGLWAVARLLERTGGDVEVAVTAAVAEGGTAVTVFIPFLDGRRRNAAA